jgi:hypothetical protein
LFSVFFCFVCCNKCLDHIMLVWRETCSVFHLQRTLSFLLLLKIERSSFSATAFGFHFRLDLRSDIVIFFHQGVFFPLIFIGFHQKRCL